MAKTPRSAKTGKTKKEKPAPAPELRYAPPEAIDAGIPAGAVYIDPQTLREVRTDLTEPVLVEVEMTIDMMREIPDKMKKLNGSVERFKKELQRLQASYKARIAELEAEYQAHSLQLQTGMAIVPVKCDVYWDENSETLYYWDSVRQRCPKSSKELYSWQKDRIRQLPMFATETVEDLGATDEAE